MRFCGSQKSSNFAVFLARIGNNLENMSFSLPETIIGLATGVPDPVEQMLIRLINANWASFFVKFGIIRAISILKVKSSAN